MKILKSICAVCLFALITLIIISPSFSETTEPKESAEKITFNFVEVEISTIIKFISEITGNNFIFDDRVRGKITIIAPTKLSVDESFALFTSILQLKGLTIVPSGAKAYKIVPSSEARQSGKIVTEEEIPVNETYITRLIPIQHIKADEALKFLQPLISRDGHISVFGPRNLLLVVDSALNIKKLASILKNIDLPPSYEEPPKMNVYFLENSDAASLAKVLDDIIRGARSVPGTRTALFQSITEVSITPDKATNSLIIVASPKDYQNIIEVIKTLDKKRRQIFVEAMIVEASVDELKDLGAQWRAMAKNEGDPIAIGGFGTINSLTLQNIANGLAGFTAGGMGNFLSVPITSINSDGTFTTSNLTVPGFAVLFSLSYFQNAVNILSTPQILTSDNEEAEIVVGENVPFISKRERDITTTNTVLSSIERKDVGITLKITPQTSEGDYVKLDLYQEISAVKESTESILTTVGPTTTKRSTKTSVVVKDGQTVVIGGLMEEREQKGVAKVPGLGDIPILGWLFKRDTTTKRKTNLLVFLTPHIIKDSTNLLTITNEKHRQLTREGKQYVEGELLVKFKEEVSNERALEIISEKGASLIKFIEDIKVYHIKLNEDQEVEDAIREFSSLSEIQYAEPNSKISIKNETSIYQQN